METSKGKPKVSSRSGQFITLDEAVAKQRKYLDHRKRVLKEKDPVRSQFFGKDRLLELLKHDDCVGIKIIFGLEDEKTPNLVLIAADENLKNLAKDCTGLKDPERSYLSNGPVCPNLCN